MRNLFAAIVPNFRVDGFIQYHTVQYLFSAFVGSWCGLCDVAAAIGLLANGANGRFLCALQEHLDAVVCHIYRTFRSHHAHHSNGYDFQTRICFPHYRCIHDVLGSVATQNNAKRVCRAPGYGCRTRTVSIQTRRYC